MEKVLVYLGGNGYTLSKVKPFLNFFKQHDVVNDVIYIQLLENTYSDLSYEQLSPKNYSIYIHRRLKLYMYSDAIFIFFGTSMGCYHIQNFAHYYPDLVYAMIWLEPTMCGGNYKLLKDFETGRGNKEWITELYDEKQDHDEWDSQTKVIDIAVSNDLRNDFSKEIRLGIIYTTLNNEGKPYTELQLKAKQGFLDELRRKGYDFLYELINGPHMADIFPKYYETLVEFTQKVISSM